MGDCLYLFHLWLVTTLSPFLMGIHICFIPIAGALFEYSVILLRMKIKTIRQIRKCLNGNLAAYLAPLANPLGATNTMQNGAVNRQTQGMIKDVYPILATIQIHRWNFISGLRPYLKGGSSISLLFSMSLPYILNSLCNCILFLREMKFYYIKVVYEINNFLIVVCLVIYFLH